MFNRYLKEANDGSVLISSSSSCHALIVVGKNELLEINVYGHKRCGDSLNYMT